MHFQMPRTEMAGTVLTYLQVHEELSGYHSCTGHQLLYPGGQGSSFLHHRELSSAGRRLSHPPLSLRRGAHSVLFHLSPIPLSSPPPEGAHQSARRQGPCLRYASCPATEQPRPTGGPPTTPPQGPT